MLSVRFVLRLLALPWVALKTAIQFYTTGTALQADKAEFGTLLWKNISLNVMSHIAPGMHDKDVKAILHHPMNPFYDKYRNLGGQGMPRFGAPVSDSSRFTWVVRPEGAKKVVLFYHGGGYLLPLTQTQFVGIMALWYALDSEHRQDTAIALLDYKLTCYGHRYPEQIHEGVEAYRELVNLGYEVILLGDSCGANLCLAVSRFAAYPEEAKAHFSQYTDYAWDFLPLPAPKYLMLVAPWLQPYTLPTRHPGVNYEGDLGSTKPDMGLKYIGGESKAKVGAWVDFGAQDNDKFDKIPALNGEGKTLVLYGEREIFRVGTEAFFGRVGKKSTSVHMQPGGIHDSMFYVEPFELRSKSGQEAMVAGKHAGKFSFKLAKEYLESL